MYDCVMAIAYWALVWLSFGVSGRWFT